MTDSAEPQPDASSEVPPLDIRLVQWLAVETLADRYAQLVDGGDDSDARIELAALFVDLPSVARVYDPHAARLNMFRMGRRRVPAQTQEQERTLASLLSEPSEPEPSDAACEPRSRWLLIGGPGSGKSTATRMVAQQLRRACVASRQGELPPQLAEPWDHAQTALAKLADEQGWTEPRRALPLRVSLPSLARWMAGRGDLQGLSLWDYLAYRIVEDLDHWELRVELGASELCGLVGGSGPVMWILDGLDEVPATAGREAMVELVRATVCDDEREADGILVSTRPQGYGGEFDDLDELELTSLPRALASECARRLLRASHCHQPAELRDRLERMDTEFAKPEVGELLHTPLHTTMAAVLIANRGSLPAARSRLFEHYFQMILRRELDKPSKLGIVDEDEGIIRTLHQRAGLALQVRSQAQGGARSSLRRTELRQLLTAIFAEIGYVGERGRERVDRLMRFAADRLVLLLHAAQGEYEFGVRSLQEFFAAQALLDGEPETVRDRLGAIALNTHWANVLAFVVSQAALTTKSSERGVARAATIDLCRAINEGAYGGEAAKRCYMGSRLATHMLDETERYGHPWMHGPLWTIALDAAVSPIQQDIARKEQQHASGRTTWTDDAELHTRLGELAGRWPGDDGQALRQRVLDHAEQALAGEPNQVRRGWRLLHGLLLVQMPEALELAERHAPQTPGAARAMVDELTVGGPIPPPAWVGRYIDRHPDWLFGWQGRWVDGSRVVELAELMNATKPLVRQAGLLLRSIEHRDIAGLEAGTRGIPDTPAWARWRRLATFMSKPSPDTLADLLDLLDTEDAIRSLWRFWWRLPWPLAACVLEGETVVELESISAMLRAGELGSADDWLTAEARWRSRASISIDDLLAFAESEGLWNQDIAVRGVLFIVFGVLESISIEALLERLEGRSELSDRAQYVLFGVVRDRSSVPLRALQLLGPFPSGLWPLPSNEALAAGFDGTEAERWWELLARRGAEYPLFSGRRSSSDDQAEALRAKLRERLEARPDQWGLIEVLRASLSPNADLSALCLPPVPDDAPDHAKATRAFLRLIAGDFEASELSGLLDKLGEHLGVLAQLLGQRTCDDETTATVLLTALDREESSAHHDALLAALYALLRRTAGPAFTTDDTWHDHELPLPCLGLTPQPPAPSRLLGITELSNIRLFETTPAIDAPFPTPSADRGQWIVFVGENGVGKTTLLRALALALASAPVASKLLDERLPMVRNGAEGRVTITLDSGQLEALLTRRGRTEQVESPSPDASRPWVVGYGVRRGNARGEQDRDAEVGALGELHSLFDRPASLHNASQWIAELEADVLREQRDAGERPPNSPSGPRERIWRSVQRALTELLGISKVEVGDGGLVLVHHDDFGRVRLDTLSDGYLTTAGWAIDMIARWVDRQYELEGYIARDLLRQMCGFVLIDEIDLHLHPTWQLRIIDDIRRLFPRLSFVVTTHNPLTLQGARRGEVYIMRRGESGIELVQRDIRPGYDVDRVLLEQFGLEHTFDRQTRELLGRHRDLVERGTPTNDPERATLELQLRERFGGVGETLGRERGASLGPIGPLAPDDRDRLLARYGKQEG